MSKITKKFDRAFQWAGEKMGNEARTGTTDEFKTLEMEMALRFDGMVRLQTTMNAYIKWLAQRDTYNGDKGVPTAIMGRTMVAHGEDFDHTSQFGNCLIEMGRTNDQVAHLQEQYTNEATKCWADSLERSVAMIKEYQNARKKLETRRLALDASTTKMQKAKRDDFRLEEELRTAKAKYEEAHEDVFRRMQDIKDAEADSVRDLTRLLDVELDYHERCADALRQTRDAWTGDAGDSHSRRSPPRRASSTAPHSNSLALTRTTNSYDTYDEPEEHSAQHMRVAIRPASRITADSANAVPLIRDTIRDRSPPANGPRPVVARSSTFTAGRSASGGAAVLPPPASSQTNVASLRGQLRPTGRDMREDDDDTDRSITPPTSYSSNASSRTNGVIGKKAPPPPPSRAKKPAPPVPNRY